MKTLLKVVGIVVLTVAAPLSHYLKSVKPIERKVVAFPDAP